MDPLTLSLLFLAPLILLNKKSSKSISSPRFPDKYIPPKQPSFRSKSDLILPEIEKELKLVGFADMFSGIFQIESKFIPSAIRYESSGYSLVKNRIKDFSKNQFVGFEYLWNSTNGLAQLFPAVALLTADKTAHNLDPRILFDPYYNIAFSIDLAYRLNKNYKATNWEKIRYGWKSLTTLKDPEGETAQAVKGRIIKGIKETGGSTSVLTMQPNFHRYGKEFQFQGILEYILYLKNDLPVS